MKYIQAVLKSAKNYQEQTLWEALYLDGNKVLENFFLDEIALQKAFSINKIIRLPFHEKELNNLTKLFPDYEDFSFLYNTIRPLKTGQKVYIDDYLDDEFVIEAGWVIVKDIYSAPNTNLIWETGSILDDQQVWFTCLQLPGVFYWNRLSLLQIDLEAKYVNTLAVLKERHKD